MNRALIKPTDILIIAAVIVIAAVSVFCFASGEGNSIIISQNGEQIAVMPLNQNGSYTVGNVTVTVRDGTAFVEKSDCKDKICMRSILKKSGDSAVCLPNKLSVRISGKPATDAITY